jgi:hypothetical protein
MTTVMARLEAELDELDEMKQRLGELGRNYEELSGIRLDVGIQKIDDLMMIIRLMMMNVPEEEEEEGDDGVDHELV